MRRPACLLLIAACVLSGVQAGAQPSKPPQVPTAPKIVPDCRADGQDIVVCGRRGERSPYRLPPQPEGFDPDGSVSSVSRERHRLYEVGGTGIGSCTNVGPGGWTGCDFLHWKDEHHQRDGNGPVVSFGVKKNDPPRR